MPPRAALPLFLLVLLLAAWWPAAQAQVRHCIAADGSMIYTDRTCDDIGATERPAHVGTPGGANGGRFYRGGCARSVQDLAYSLGNAIQSGDVNQVAGVYDWSGMSTASGYRLMQRLDALARRPLVDVQPMYAGGANEYGYDVVQFDDATGAVVSAPPAKPRLIGLRVEQTLANGTTPSRTVFGLRRHMGCWWVRL